MRAPRFWAAGLDPRSREAAPLTRRLLTPLAALYTWGVRSKLRSARPVQVPIPVVCIGNLTVGGVGKTPVVEAVRARLVEAGLRASSLSRGYGGREAGPLKVTPNMQADAVGDEPLMLASSGESWIGRDRVAAARAMSEDGVQAIVMDDGHQNPSLSKDVSILVVDSAAPFGNGYVLPKGPLREPVQDGLSRAHGILLMGDGPIPPAITASALPVIRAHLEPTGPAPEGPLVAFAGIGRPEKFFDGLRAAGGDLREDVPYPDHHAFSANDLSYLRKLAGDHGARLITTTKDHVRLPIEAQAQVLTFPVRAVFDDTDALDALLAPVLYPVTK